MLDKVLVEKLKSIAERHGMSMASYLRSLFISVNEAEDAGIYAPRLLKKALVAMKLQGTGIIPLPVKLFEECTKYVKNKNEIYEKAYRIGRNAGTLLHNLGVSLEEAIPIFIEGIGSIYLGNNRIVVLVSQEEYIFILYFIKGLASVYKAITKIEGSMLIIEQNIEKTSS